MSNWKSNGDSINLQVVIILVSCLCFLIPLPSVDAKNTADISYKETLILIGGYDDFTITIEIIEGETIQYNWTSDYDIVFKIDDGGWGSAPVYLIQDHAKGTYTAPRNNTYDIIFESQEYDVNTTVNYEILVEKDQDEEPIKGDIINIGNSEKSEDSHLPLYIIVIIVVVAVNIIIGVFTLLFLRAKNKKKPDEPVREPPPTVQTPIQEMNASLPPQQPQPTPPPTQKQNIELNDLPELQFRP